MPKHEQNRPNILQSNGSDPNSKRNLKMGSRGLSAPSVRKVRNRVGIRVRIAYVKPFWTLVDCALDLFWQLELRHRELIFGFMFVDFWPEGPNDPCSMPRSSEKASVARWLSLRNACALSLSWQSPLCHSILAAQAALHEVFLDNCRSNNTVFASSTMSWTANKMISGCIKTWSHESSEI